MPYFTLYEYSLRRVFTNLRNGFYMNYNKNPFEQLPYTIANAIMSAAWCRIRANYLRVDSLRKLLESKTITELIISNVRDLNLRAELPLLNEILQILSSGCENLQTLYLLNVNGWRGRIRWRRIIRPGELQALQNLLPNTLKLKYLKCSFPFNLNALKNCRMLRKLSLHFQPQQHWHAFLEDNEGHLQKHECLKYFTICPLNVSPENVPHPDIVVILQHCPELISLGLIESSRALSQLHRISQSQLKLRQCYWKDVESPNNAPNRIDVAVRMCPLIEDLELDDCNKRSLPCLKNLENLVCLNIKLDASVSSDEFNSALQEIGPNLKHLSFEAANSMDISLLLQNCLNLISLRIFGGGGFCKFARTSVSLPKLQHLTINYEVKNDNDGRVFRLFDRCNQLTDLFLIDVYFEDERLHYFIAKNSLSYLQVAYLNRSNLTVNGFRQILRNAPRLEKVYIYADDHSNAFIDNFRTVITETNHRVNLFNDPFYLLEYEFFKKRKARHHWYL